MNSTKMEKNVPLNRLQEGHLFIVWEGLFVQPQVGMYTQDDIKFSLLFTHIHLPMAIEAYQVTDKF